MEKIGKKVNELLDKAANDYASENQQHDFSAQYSAFIAGANYVLLELVKKMTPELNKLSK